MAEHSKSIQDLIEQLDVAGGGTYKGEFDGYHVFDITDEGTDRWLKIKETGDHIYQVIYEDECKKHIEWEWTLQQIIDEFVITL
jgi:hypothetical protein